MNQNLRILIVDDNKAIAMTLDVKLRQEGFETKVVSNGKEALDVLEKEKFDLLILDLIMPELNGFGVLSILKERGLKIPVIVSSDLSQAEDISKAKELGAVDFFKKSDMSMTEMVEKIKQYFKI